MGASLGLLEGKTSYLAPYISYENNFNKPLYLTPKEMKKKSVYNFYTSCLHVWWPPTHLYKDGATWKPSPPVYFFVSNI